MADLLCLNNLEGVGVPCEQLTPITGLSAIILARPGVTFDDSEDFANQTTWKTKIAAKDVIVLPSIKTQENQQVEDGVYQSPFGDKTHLWNGQRGLRLSATFTLDQHKIAQTYSNKNWEMFRRDRNNNIIGVLQDDGTIKGFELGYFYVFDQMEPTESEPAFTPIEFQEIDPGEYNAQGCYVNPSWRASDLDPLGTVTLVCSTVDTFIFSATVSYVPTSTFNADGTAISIAVSGLDETSFKVIDQAGDIEVVTVEESATVPGTYTITGVDITSGSCQVVAVVTALYESAVQTLTAV